MFIFGVHLNHLTMMKRASMLTAFLLLVSLSCITGSIPFANCHFPGWQIASAGGYTLSETVGEMTMVENVQCRRIHPDLWISAAIR